MKIKIYNYITDVRIRGKLCKFSIYNYITDVRIRGKLCKSKIYAGKTLH